MPQSKTARGGDASRKARRSRKRLRRVPVTTRIFGRYGVRRGDSAIVDTAGDVRAGDFGYFSIIYGGRSYRQFRFVCEANDRCLVDGEGTGLCFRERPDRCCDSHEATPYGRVVGFERERKPVETNLELRPFDEREQGETILLAATAKDERKTLRASKTNPPAKICCVCADHTPEIYRSIGVRKGEKFLATLRPDPKPRQIVIIVCNDPHAPGWDAGRFVRFEPYEEGVPGVTLDTPDDGEHTYALRAYDLYKMGEILPRENPNAERIAKLRARLDKLTSEDDITDCTARLRLEREIFDLEQGETREQSDEWEDLIGTAGRER